MKITLQNAILDAINMGYANPTATFSCPSGVDHYRLLAYLGQQFNNVELFDIGSSVGSSALALALNPSNHVHSFDIKDLQPGPKPNITYHIGNILEMPEWTTKMVSSPFICLDVDPHDGEFEEDFIEALEANSYRGMLYMDDVLTERYPLLNQYWTSIPLKKVDVAKVGHGSGIVLFNPEDEVEVL